LPSHRWTTAIALTAALLFTLPAVAQQPFKPVLNTGDRLLHFDWPALSIGTGEYAEGPTGVTVFHFAKPALAAVDVRGGAPGTVNTDYLRLGYNTPELDAVVFAGGSWYGLEATTAVATALKDDGERSGGFDNIALAVGAIIYDLGGRRLNEIYPDKTLAQAALRAARPGVFALGSEGAGRFAMSGGYFGCGAHSGQGGAFRQVGAGKIAAFVVVNALGVVTDREGRVVACYPGPGWPAGLRTTDLLANTPQSRSGAWTGPPPGQTHGSRNTTISLVVTNQKLGWDELQRLAVQVHSSMGRAIQPFATVDDGDVLYAVSTQEVDAAAGQPVLAPIDLGAIAAETMWDAILSSVPEQPMASRPAAGPAPEPASLAAFTGEFVFGPEVRIRVTQQGGRLFAQAVGRRDAYAITRAAPVELLPAGDTAFTVPNRYPLALRFDPAGTLTINAGHWAQTGRRTGS